MNGPNAVYVSDLEAGATILKGQICKISAGKWVPATAADGVNLGVAAHAAVANQLIKMCVQGEVDALYAEQLTRFGAVSSDADGKLVNAPGAGETVLGMALEAGQAAPAGYVRLLLSALKQVGGTDSTVAQVPQFTALDITVGAENAGVVPITGQVVDYNGDPIAGTFELLFEVQEGTMLQALVGEFTLADGGAGAVISTTGHPRLHFQTDAAGAFAVDLTDVSDDRAESIPVTVQIVNHNGPVESPSIVDAVFA